MEFSWIYDENEPKQIKYFLRELGISKRLLAKIKFQGGKIKVNHQIQNVLFYLTKNDQLQVVIPNEAEHETMLLDTTPIDIVFEDKHYLVVNKPVNIPSIPAQYHPNGTMANRVKAYYKEKNYANQVVHIVTRLDRDTTGLMLFAKHGFAHALLDQELRNKRVVKIYQALVGGNIANLDSHGRIDLPIGRDHSSLMKRQVISTGQQAITEYWIEEKYTDFAAVRIQLHTGRTHQIRVHFSAIGCPLMGDELYGREKQRIKRQALHCSCLYFKHPFTKQEIELKLPLPLDMKNISSVINN